MNFYSNLKPEGTASSHFQKSWTSFCTAFSNLTSGITHSYNSLCKASELVKKAYDNIAAESEIFVAVSLVAGALSCVPVASVVAAAILSSPLTVAGAIALSYNSKEVYELAEETYSAFSMNLECTKELTYAGSEITQAGILYAEDGLHKAADFASELSSQVKNWESCTHNWFVTE
ncbi:MAG: hypothetical protein EB127_19320 [Alphaproteobacteria bacterium]|nr:hypothetical protein [Alphaproteobacteria bacterium]